MNITKIKFGTDGWRAIIGQDFTFQNLARVAEGTALWLKNNFKDPSVMVGHDCRFNGKIFSELVAEVFAKNGVKVFLAPSFVSTPMVSLAVNKRQASAGVVLTASHNPSEYSGFKLKGSFGGPLPPSAIAEVEALIPQQTIEYKGNISDPEIQSMIQWFDMEALYLNHIKDIFDLRLIRESGIKTGYDAMYGAGQNVFRKILPNAELLHCDFNPSFNGTAPEPIERNLGEFQELIKNKNLSIGLATDGDADRIGLFDENGNFVDSHHIILLLIHYLKNFKKLDGKVVITFSVTPRIEKLCKQLGIPCEITKIGFKYICEIMLNENVMVGGEESGGIAIAGHVPERDGIFIGLTIMEMMAKTGKKLTELVEEIYSMVGKFFFARNDLHLTEEEKERIMNKLKTSGIKSVGNLPVASSSDLDGYKYFLPDDQWVMIRASGTEPVLRIYGESSTKEKAEEIIRQTIEAIRA